MRLIRVVRHGLTKSNVERRLMGRMDEPLSEEGRKQSRDLRDKLQKGIDVILTSPLERAYETAVILNDGLGVALIQSALLMERDSGKLSGRLWDEIPSITDGAQSLEKLRAELEIDYSPWGGESKEAVRKRVTSFLSFVKSRNEYCMPLVVTHAGIIRVMYLLFGRKLAGPIANTSIHEFDLDTLNLP